MSTVKTLENTKLLTRREAADQLRLRPQTLAARECHGNSLLPVIKIGGRCRYRLADVEALIQRSTRYATASAR